MKFKMAEKSLFAVLLRSPWWISFGVVGLITLASGVLLPKEYFVVGALAGFPIFVVGCIAAWRQLRAPSPAKVAEMLDAVNSMPWRSFADTLESAWTREGCTVERLKPGGAADMALILGGKTTLVSARRWKAATHGVEPLRESARSHAGTGRICGCVCNDPGAAQRHRPHVCPRPQHCGAAR